MSILDLEIPIYDAIPHLVVMTGLHLLLYQLQRGSEVLGRTERTTLVCEIVSPKRSVVFRRLVPAKQCASPGGDRTFHQEDLRDSRLAGGAGVRRAGQQHRRSARRFHRDRRNPRHADGRAGNAGGARGYFRDCWSERLIVVRPPCTMVHQSAHAGRTR